MRRSSRVTVRPLFVALVMAAMFGLTACETSGGGGQSGQGGGGGGNPGSYQGTWIGTATNTGCTDTAGFTTAGYCAGLRGATVALSLGIIQGSSTGTNGSVCVILNNGSFLGNASGGCATNSNTIPIAIGTAGVTFTGIASGNAGSPYNNLTVNVTAWNSLASGTTMSGTWAATVTSDSVTGNAQVQFTLASMTMTSMTAGFSPLAPDNDR